MHFIDGKTVRRVCEFESLVAYLEDCHRQPKAVLEDMLLRDPRDGRSDIFFNRAAWQPGEAAGVKVITVFPDNQSATPPRPNIQAVYVLMDGETGAPLAAIDGTEITYWKTAADSALGTKQLAREGAETLVMVGAGAMAGPLVRAHRAVRPSLRRVLVWNRSAERADDLVADLRPDGISAERVDDLDAAVGEGDVVCCATMAKTPLVKGELLRPGAHLDLVGAFTPDMREADDAALARGRLFVDTRETALDTGELGIPIAAGTFSADRILGDHFELAQGGVVGRTAPEDVTIFKNGGGGHLDLMTARYIHSRAQA
ncbi:MAG: hypothetical protein NXI16_02030 [Alphaproteobacteria bacterium]|nr:hypothetical protein [Alphaproteobacteria bacterium]